MVRIEEIVAEVEAGAIYKGKVTRLADFRCIRGYRRK